MAGGPPPGGILTSVASSAPLLTWMATSSVPTFRRSGVFMYA